MILDLGRHVQSWQSLRDTDKPKGRLVVRVLGPAKGQGQVLFGLYDAETPFPAEGQHLTSLKTPATDATHVIFNDIPHGEYAVAVIHDLNGNNKLDMRLGFLPAEPLGFSNGAKLGWFGPPKYKDACFQLESSELEIIIEVC